MMRGCVRRRFKQQFEGYIFISPPTLLLDHLCVVFTFFAFNRHYINIRPFVDGGGIIFSVLFCLHSAPGLIWIGNSFAYFIVLLISSCLLAPSQLTVIVHLHVRPEKS